jgi:hypothetical protein
MRRHPWLRLKAWSWSVTEVLFLFIQLMRGIPDKSLRRDYRLRLWTVVKRRPSIQLLRTYAIKCALHYHFTRLIAEMVVTRAALVEQPLIEPAARHHPSLSSSKMAS